MKRKILLFVLLTVVLLTVAVIQNKALGITHMNVNSSDIPAAFSGFKIAQISDLHNDEFGEGNKKLFEKIRKCEADIIVVTGDVIDSRRTDVDVTVSFFKEAVKIAPIYYVNGNHESRISEYEYLKEEIKKIGVVVLENEAVNIGKDGESITLIGINDPAFDMGGEYFDKNDSEMNMAENINTLKGEGYNILLSHRPEYFDLYVSCDVDLVFTGHAHGGQFRIPFVGGLIAPGQGLFPEYDSGMYSEGNTHMIVSRGIGRSVIPLRINNSPEIILAEFM